MPSRWFRVSRGCQSESHSQSQNQKPDIHKTLSLVSILINQWLNQRIVGTVTTKASVETRSIEAASDSTALYLAAKSTTTVARGKLQHTNASRAKGLTTWNRCNKANRTADCTVTRARVPTNTAGEKRIG